MSEESAPEESAPEESAPVVTVWVVNQEYVSEPMGVFTSYDAAWKAVEELTYKTWKYSLHEMPIEGAGGGVS